MNKNVFITGALPLEVSGIRALGTFQKAALPSGLKYYSGVVRGKGVALFVSGIGDEAAYRTAKAVCESLKPKVYIAVGLSAALREGLHPGAVVIGESFISPDGSPTYEADAALISGARTTLKDTALFAPLAASRKVICSWPEKRLIAANCDAAALDMESFGAARACAEAGVPFLAVRAISDSLEEDLPVDFNLFTNKGRMDWPRFTLHLLTHPGSIPPLMRLGKNSRRAAKNLASVVDTVLARL